jgi:hypothetical protein
MDMPMTLMSPMRGTLPLLLALGLATSACGTEDASETTPAAVTKVALQRDTRHGDVWCVVMRGGGQDGSQRLCQSPRGPEPVDAALRVDCPTGRVAALGVLEGEPRSVTLQTGHGAQRLDVVTDHASETAGFGGAVAVRDFPARLRIESSSGRDRSLTLPDPQAFCREHPNLTTSVEV